MSITRNQDLIRAFALYHYDTNTHQHPAYYVTIGSHKERKSRTGSRVVNWKGKIESHQNATSDMTGIHDDIKWRRGFVDLTYFDAGNGVIRKCSTYGAIANNFALDYVVTWTNSRANAWATAKVYSKIRSLQTQLQGAVALAEMKKTLDMLRRPMQSLYPLCADWLGFAKKSRPKGRPLSKKDKTSWNQALGQAWLEKTYGWGPLLQDINGLGKAFNELLETERVVRFRVSAVDDKDFGTNVSEILSSSGTPLWHLLTQQVSATDIVTFRGAVKAQAATTAAEKAARFGFTPDQFIPSAWELLPWSFLIDYFTNIGDILEAATTSTSNLVFLSKSSIRTKHISRYAYFNRDRILSTIGGVTRLIGLDGSPSWFEANLRGITRVASTGISVPDLVFKIPGQGQLFNIAVLLNQARALHPQRTSGRNWRI